MSFLCGSDWFTVCQRPDYGRWNSMVTPNDTGPCLIPSCSWWEEPLNPMIPSFVITFNCVEKDFCKYIRFHIGRTSNVRGPCLNTWALKMAWAPPERLKCERVFGRVRLASTCGQPLGAESVIEFCQYPRELGSEFLICSIKKHSLIAQCETRSIQQSHVTAIHLT